LVATVEHFFCIIGAIVNVCIFSSSNPTNTPHHI